MVTKNKIKISTNFGTIILSVDTLHFPSGECYNCGKKIYFIRLPKNRKIIVSKISDDEFTMHNLVCNKNKAQNAHVVNVKPKMGHNTRKTVKSQYSGKNQ